MGGGEKSHKIGHRRKTEAKAKNGTVTTMAGSAGRSGGGGGNGGGNATDAAGSNPGEQQPQEAGCQNQTETSVETRVEVLRRMSESKPFNKLKPGVVDMVKRVTAMKIFPYSKFLMKEEDVNMGYVQLMFLEMGWTGKDARMAIARSRHWQVVAQEIMKRCSERRSRTLGLLTKTCKGKFKKIHLVRVILIPGLSLSLKHSLSKTLSQKQTTSLNTKKNPQVPRRFWIFTKDCLGPAGRVK